MTYKKYKRKMKENGWTESQTIHEKGVMRFQILTKKGKTKTLTVDR